MDWRGINQHSTPVDNRRGVAIEQYNATLQVKGELRRRPGMANSSIATQAGAIINIASAAPSHGNFLTFQVADEIHGYGVAHGPNGVLPEPAWDKPKWKRPTGIAGVPVAPVVVSVSASPTSPRAYPAGVVTFTPTITYDGLSGPLIYLWSASGFAANPNPPSGTASTFATDFNAFCTPGAYSITLSLSTTFNGFSALGGTNFTVS